MKNRGFTIVELLIVIVVIGILAAIVIVTFTGIQQRVKNTARIQTAQTYIKALRAASANGTTMPVFWTGDAAATGASVSASSACLGEGYANITGTTAGDCYVFYPNASSYTSENTAVTNHLKTQLPNLGTFPSGRVGFTGNTEYFGPVLFRESHTVSGGPVEMFTVVFALEGQNQNCNMPVLTHYNAATPKEYVPSTTGNTIGYFTTYTECRVSLTGVR